MLVGEDGSSWGDPIPETDSTPHINIGPQNQCTIPTYPSVPKRMSPQPVYEDLLWDPGISSCTDSEGKSSMRFIQCKNEKYCLRDCVKQITSEDARLSCLRNVTRKLLTSLLVMDSKPLGISKVTTFLLRQMT